MLMRARNFEFENCETKNDFAEAGSSDVENDPGT